MEFTIKFGGFLSSLLNDHHDKQCCVCLAHFKQMNLCDVAKQLNTGIGAFFSLHLFVVLLIIFRIRQ